MKLGEILIEAGLLSNHKLQQALIVKRIKNLKLGQYLVREGIVDDRDQPMVAREGHHPLEVRQLDQRVGQRLDVDGARGVPDARGPGLRGLRVNDGVSDAQSTELVVEQAARASVEAILDEQMVAA